MGVGGNSNSNSPHSPTSIFAASGKRKRQQSKDRHDQGDDDVDADDPGCDGSRHSSGSKDRKQGKKDKKKKKDKQKKRKRSEKIMDINNRGGACRDDDEDNHDDVDDVDDESKRRRKDNKAKKKLRKRKIDDHGDAREDGGAIADNQKMQQHQQLTAYERKSSTKHRQYFPFEYEHILAPMVGASELAFRLLCRKYGATLCYTPMMSAKQFSDEADRIVNSTAAGATTSTSASTTANMIANSNICEFQTIPQDRPLVVHFSANNPAHFASAAKHVEHLCDAIDLNLGCPQRTAYLGHFGSYLLDACDRQLVLDIVRTGAKAVSIPIFVKIRLLDKVEDTIRLCQELRGAGASLIAIHARYRASWERTGAGARDGPAMLDQIALIKRSMPDFPIISNGNVITYEDVVANRKFTGADGIMSAEGMLDNPALYLPRLRNIVDDDAADGDIDVQVPIHSPLNNNIGRCASSGNKSTEKAKRKLQKKLREVEAIEKKVKELGVESINDDQQIKLQAKSNLQAELQNIENINGVKPACASDKTHQQQTKSVKLSDLTAAADNKLLLAREYLALVRMYPTKIRSVIFHVRRMCKELLERYQLMEECIASTTLDDVESVLSKFEQYIQYPSTFHYDREKAARDMEALAAKRREEGKRRAYEERMTRKAKREGLSDLGYYLRMGAEVPTVEAITRLKSVSKEARLEVWKKDHSQHCMSFHFDDGGCKRGRSCAFLHVDAKGGDEFVVDDEVAG